MEAQTSTPERATDSESKIPEAVFSVRESERYIAQTALLLVTGTALAVLFLVSVLFSEPKQEVGVTSPETENPVRSILPAFAALDLEAEAVFVYDVREDRPVFAKNEEIQMPLASLTKLMTAIVVTESLSYDSVVAVSPSALQLEGDSGLYANEVWNARDLLDFMLLASSNDSAHALAGMAGAAVLAAGAKAPGADFYGAFVERMNTKAGEMGLTQTYFLNETGLDADDSISGGYGSARDVAYLLAYALTHTPRSLEATTYPELAFTSRSNITHTAENTNEITATIPGLIASKTGYTPLAGGNLVIAFDAGFNRPFIISVLHSTRDGRFTDVQKLVDATMASLRDETHSTARP